MKKNLTLILLVISLFAWNKSAAQAPAQAKDVMLQGFYWDSYTLSTYGNTRWATLNTQVQEITQSFSLLWLPPSAKSSGVGYHPEQWSNQNSSWGTQTELKTLVTNLKNNGTRCVADIVVNHRGNKSSWCDFYNDDYGAYGQFQLTASHICKDDEVNTATSGTCKGTATGAYDYNWNIAGDYWGGYSAARDLDHSNTYVRDNIKAYLQWLKNEIGYDGWRYDLVKGYDPKYNNEYNTAAGAYMSVGEYWDGNFDKLKAWVTGAGNNSMVFDFSCKYNALHNAFMGTKNLTNLVWKADGTTNQPAGMIHHNSTKRYAVTFVDNHDTFRDGSKFTGDVLQAYAFLLSSPGIPCVFYPHWYSNKTAIKAMIDARKAAGLHSESNVVVNQTSASIYVATATGIYGTLIVKIGSDNYTPPSGYTLAASGNGYAIWTKIETTPTPQLTVSPAGGTYAGGTTVTMSATNNGKIYYTLDGTTPSASSTEYTAPISITVNNTVLKAIAINATGASEVSTNTYITEVIDYGPITVRFKRPTEWTKVNIWAWTSNGNIFTETWPGKTMTDLGNGWWSYTFDAAIKTVNLLFNNGATSTIQTADVYNVIKSTCFEFNGAKVDPIISQNCGLPSGIHTPTLNNNIQLYPNPVQNILNINSTEPIKQIEIYNYSGQLVLTQPFDNQTSVDLSTLNSGIYIIKIRHSNEQLSVAKFIKIDN